MKISLIRHTTLQIPEGICYGQSDVDVSERFNDELDKLKPKLINDEFHAIYASPLQRCSKLAHALNLGDVMHDHRLKELDFGDWEMQPWNDMPRDYFDEWAQNYAELAPPNGETFTQLQQRGVMFLNEMLNKHAQQHIAVVSHGGMIRALIAYVLNMPLKSLFRFNVDYASITQLNFNDDVPKIEFVNR